MPRVKEKQRVSIEGIDRMLTMYGLKHHMHFTAVNWDNQHGGDDAVRSLKKIQDFCHRLHKELESDQNVNTLNALTIILTSCQKFIFNGDDAKFKPRVLAYPRCAVIEQFNEEGKWYYRNTRISDVIVSKIDDFLSEWKMNDFQYLRNIEWSEIAMAMLLTPENVLSHIVEELKNKRLDMNYWHENSLDKTLDTEWHINQPHVRNIINDSYFKKLKSFFPIKNERRIYKLKAENRQTLDFRSNQRLAEESGLSNHLVIALPLDADPEDIEDLLEDFQKALN